MKNESNIEKPLRILHIEDSPRDAEIIRERLSDADFPMELDWASNEQEFAAFLQRGGYDLVLADYEIPGFDAPVALQLTKSLCPDLPFICVSGAIGEEKAVELLKLGATDYVSKVQLSNLPLAIERALNEVREHEARKQAEEALRKNEEKFRALFEHAGDYILILDPAPEGGPVILDANESACRVHGLTRNELIGMTIFDLDVEKRNPGEVRETMQRLMSGESVLFETAHRRKDGSSFPVEVSAKWFQVADGPPLIFSIERDITKRKWTEETMRLHQEIFLNMRDAVNLIRAKDGVIVYTNKAFEEMFGYADGEMLGKHVSIVNAPTDKRPEDTARDIMKEIEEKGTWDGEVKNIKKDGAQFWCSVRVSLFNHSEHGEVILSVHEDITERQAAQKSLKESHRRWQGTFDAIGDPVCVVNKESVIEQCNIAMVHFLKRPMDEIVGCVCWEVVHDAHEHIEGCPMSRMLESHQREVLRVEREGRWLVIVVHPCLDSDGRLVGGVHIISDVTDNMNIEAQLRQSQKMEAVGQLAGGIAHDFNNLLQVILGYGDMALDKAEADSALEKDIEEIMKAGHRAKTLVSQLLAFSRRQVLDMKDVNLNDSIADLMKMLRRVIGEHITLDAISGHDLGIVRADPGQVEQILMNLCVNARDAMGESGKITIETENVRIDETFRMTHSWAEPGRYVLLSVTDTGCGMDKETLGKVFEPFFTTKDVGKGTGLGLATVYGLVKQHKGMVHIYSEVGKGTTFKIYLPLVERSAAAVGDKIEGLVPGGTETILVAEDDELVRKLTKAFLEHAGYTVLTACDGEEALRVFEEHADEIDMALLDVMMPCFGGRAVYERIRKARPDLRFLFASGYSMNAIHTNFVLDEGLTLIQKPCQRDDLLRRVREVLDGK